MTHSFPTRRSSDLAIALGLAHAEIVLQAAGRIVALFMANHHDAALTQPSEAAEDCMIVAASALTRERAEFVENTRDIMFEEIDRTHVRTTVKREQLV